MFGSILQRMIFGELVKVFVLSLLGLTGILLLAGIVQEASQRGLTPAQILMVIPLLIPSTLPYTIPATTLFATCVTYGRLAADNEILAVKAAGVSVLHAVWPAVVLGALMSGATLALYHSFIPSSHRMLRSMFLGDVEELLYGMLKRDHSINHPRLNYYIWVRQVQGKRLLGALFKRRDARGQYDLVVEAREAELQVDFQNQEVRVYMRDGEVWSPQSQTHATFKERVWPVEMPESPFGGKQQHKPRELTWDEIHRRQVEVDAEVQQLYSEIAMKIVHQSLKQIPDDLHLHLTQLNQKLFFTYQERYALGAELHMRPALAVGCLCFVLVGCPVGIWFCRSDYLSAFTTCFLPIILFYYPLLLCGTNLAKQGQIARLGWAYSAAAIWMADAVMLLVAAPLFWRSLKN